MTRPVIRLSFSAGFVVALLIASLPRPAEAGLLDNVPEAAGYKLVYNLDIPAVSNFRDAKAPTYSINNAASTKLYDRIAYYMELSNGTTTQWAYTSMDAFDVNAYRIGLPHNVLNPVARQQRVANMNVASNVPGIVTGVNIATGSIEMWPSNYGGNTSAYVPTGSSAFDWNDSGFNTGNGHSSFQVHNWDLDGAGAGTAGQTVIAYNRYGHSDSNPAAVGIGNRPAGDLDWTFATNAGTYSLKNLQVLVREVPANSRPNLPGLPAAPAHILANVPQAASYGLVYQLPINGSNAFAPSQYVVNNSASIPDGSFGRIAYYVELESAKYGKEFVWVSMDAFNLDASLIGVPNTAAHIQQMIVNNMNVVASDGSGVTEGEGLLGNIEFWNTNYGGNATNLIPGGTNSFDFDDLRSTSGNYGSMQIHNYLAGQTLFAFNHWNGGIPDLGIGNDPATGRSNYNPDWTFADQSTGNGADQYTVRNLYVFVQDVNIPEPASLTLLALGAGAIGGFLRRRRMV